MLKAEGSYGERQLLAIVALLVGTATIVLAVAVAVSEFPRGLAVLGCFAIAGAAAWYGVLQVARVAGLAVAGVALAGAVALIVVGGGRFVDLLLLAGFLVSLAAARATLDVHVDLASAAPPARPVLFYNPKSGSSKAERFHLADEARKRGIEPIELGPPWDLEALVRSALDRGADGLAMAGGDGSQAIVAAIAAERGACVHTCRYAQPLARSISASTATTSSAPWTRSSTAGSGSWTLPRSTVACSSTTSRSVSTPRPSSIGVPRREDPHAARHRARRPRLRQRREARPALDGPGRPTHPLGSNGSGLQQLLPTRTRDRLRHAPEDRRRPARDHSHRRADRARRARPSAAAPAAHVVRANVRGRRGSPDRRRHRRRSAYARRAAELSHPARSPARPRGAQAPGRRLGHGARRAVGRRGRAGTNRHQRGQQPATPR